MQLQKVNTGRLAALLPAAALINDFNEQSLGLGGKARIKTQIRNSLRIVLCDFRGCVQTACHRLI